MAPLREECSLHPTQIANVRPDVPMGEKPIENDLSRELNSVLHPNTQWFVCLFVFCTVLTYTDCPRHATRVKIEEEGPLFRRRILPGVLTVRRSHPQMQGCSWYLSCHIRAQCQLVFGNAIFMVNI